jgi:hypothetical protein
LKAEYVRLSVELRDHIAEGIEKLLSIATLNELADSNFFDAQLPTFLSFQRTQKSSVRSARRADHARPRP